MARITVEDCLEKIPSRFDLIIMASKEQDSFQLQVESLLLSGIMINQH